MPTTTLQTGKPEFATTIRTQRPYVLLNVKCQSDFVARLRYLSTHKGTNASGDQDITEFTSDTELPAFSEAYHPLVLLGTLKIITKDLANLTNRDGSPRYMSMAKAAAFFAGEYERELQRAKDQIRRRYIARRSPGFQFGGAEIGMQYRPRQFA
jgi:hypothetical protein